MCAYVAYVCVRACVCACVCVYVCANAYGAHVHVCVISSNWLVVAKPQLQYSYREIE